MSHSPDNVSETMAIFAEAVDRNDFASFNAAYQTFLGQFAGFVASRSDKPTEVPARNAMFGQNGFFLTPTSPVQGRKLLAQARSASRIMAKVPLTARLQLLELLEAKVAHYQEAILLTITADTGKPIDLSRAEMAKGKEWFSVARDELHRRIAHPSSGNLVSRNRPRGAVQIISAYNYPYALAISGIVCALASGNGVIVSAPLKAPNWVFPFAQAANEALDAFIAATAHESFGEALAKEVRGLVRYSIGVSKELTANADVVHLVGSDQVGASIRDARGYRPTILEMGGCNMVTVMQSALDGHSAQSIAEKIYGGFGPATGQRCTAPRILCVQEGAQAVVDELIRLCNAGPKAGDLGNPFHSGTKIGPLVDRGAHEKMQAAIALAQALGATVHGQLEVGEAIVALAAHKTAYWVNPILIDWSPAQADSMNETELHACLKDEIFGPLLHVLRPVHSLNEAIASVTLLDKSGLAGALFTGDVQDIEQYGNEVSVTSLAINGAPKDQSPRGPHGHPGDVTIGGADPFGPYEIKSVSAFLG